MFKRFSQKGTRDFEKEVVKLQDLDEFMSRSFRAIDTFKTLADREGQDPRSRRYFQGCLKGAEEILEELAKLMSSKTIRMP